MEYALYNGGLNGRSGGPVQFLSLVPRIALAHPLVNVRVSRRILCFRGRHSRILNTLSIYSSSYDKLQEPEHHHENHTRIRIIRTQTHSDKIIRPERPYAHTSYVYKIIRSERSLAQNNTLVQRLVALALVIRVCQVIAGFVFP